MSTPTKGVIFGTAIDVDFQLIPLSKGSRLQLIKTELVETQRLRISNPKQTKQKVTSRNVVSEVWKFPEDAMTEEIDGQDTYIVHRRIQLPKSLRYCTQSADSMGINITHYLKIRIDLMNPDSHVSEVPSPAISATSATMVLINNSFMQC